MYRKVLTLHVQQRDTRVIKSKGTGQWSHFMDISLSMQSDGRLIGGGSNARTKSILEINNS